MKRENVTHESARKLTQYQKGISIFQDNYNYFMSTGLDKTTAYFRAVDQHRKYKSEVHVDQGFYDNIEDGGASLDEIIGLQLMFNKFFHKEFSEGRPARKENALKLFCCMIRKAGLDGMLTKPQLDVINHLIGDASPKTDADTALLMGYKPSKKGRSSGLRNLRNYTIKRLKDIGLVSLEYQKSKDGKHEYSYQRYAIDKSVPIRINI